MPRSALFNTICLLFLGLVTASDAAAQGNTAQPSYLGYLSISGCPSTTPCFIPYGATIPTSGGGGGGAVTVADGADVTQGAIADAAWSGSGSSTVIAALKAIWTKLGSVVATVTLTPTALTSTNLSSAVSVTNTFQSIQVSTAGRKGCTIQNNGTHNMSVFFGAIGSATAVASVALSAGNAVTCAVNPSGVLTDQVSITGTAGDVFFANFQ